MIDITNECNMELMARYPDNYFDLAIVDPPYGIKEADGRLRTRKKHKNIVKHIEKKWDSSIPDKEYFNELKRVSKNQIIFGANYMVEHLTPSMGWIFWDKKIGGDFSDGEFVFTSFKRAAKLVSIWCETGGGAEKRIHPTQKPKPLYEWILSNYAEPNQKILDTHIGSGSIAIAVDNMNKIDKMNLTLIGCELDKDYYTATMKRIKEQTNWQSLF